MINASEFIGDMFGNRPRALFWFGEPTNVSFMVSHFRLREMLLKQPLPTKKDKKKGRHNRHRDGQGFQQINPDQTALAVGLCPVLIFTYKEPLDRDYSAIEVVGLAEDETREREYFYDISYPNPEFAREVVLNFADLMRMNVGGKREMIKQADTRPGWSIHFTNAHKNEHLVFAIIGTVIPSIIAQT